MNVLFVCTGNTCRSPMAAGLFKKMLADNNVADIDVSSAGIAAFSGDAVSFLALQSAQRYGVDISTHRARRLNDYLLLKTDVFVCMSDSHRNMLLNHVPENKIYVLGDGIEDPFGSDSVCYDNCCDQIFRALKDLYHTLLDEVNIIKMDERHVFDVAIIEKACFSKPWSEMSIAQELENENAHFLVAVSHQKMIGYMGILVATGECSVTNIAVLPEKRCQGIGTKLMDKALREALLRQDEFMTLEVRESNTTAIKLYEKFGFERVGQRKHYYDDPTEDAVLLTKYLTAKGKKDEDTGN